MADPLFTHTDLNDTRLTVTDDLISLVAEGEGTITTHTPTGDDAVDLARAVLATAGDTGCKVVSEREMHFRLSMAMANAGSDAARSMRERIIEIVDAYAYTNRMVEEISDLPLFPDGDTGHTVVHEADLIGAQTAVVAMRQRAAYLVEYSPDTSRADLVEAIRALPLLPDNGDEDTVEVRNGLQQVLRTDPAPLLPDAPEVAHSGCSQPASETPTEQPAESDAARMLAEIRSRVDQDVRIGRTLAQAELDRERLLGMVDHLRAKHAEAHATSMRRGEQLTRVEAHLRRLTTSDGRSVETLAEKSARLRAATVHVATPEGITPCGRGHHDVTVTALIREATCLECLCTLAQAPQDDITEAGRAAAHDPAACTDLGCLGCRVAQIEWRTTQVTDRLDALELAAREHTQSGGADHVQVTGGGYDTDEYQSCGATVEPHFAPPYTCARRVAHEGGCGPKRDT